DWSSDVCSSDLLPTNGAIDNDAREFTVHGYAALMFRFLLKLIICLGLAIAAGLFLLAFRSGDVIYTAYEWVSPARFHQFDNLIRTVAAEHELDPMLVKAVVWRDSRFDPRKI